MLEVNAKLPKTMGLVSTLLYFSRTNFIHLHCSYQIKVLCEQTREASNELIFLAGLCLILFGFGNIVADFHV